MSLQPENARAFFDVIRPLFGGRMTQSQVDGIGRLLSAFAAYGSGDRRHLAYILATAFHETGRRMQPVRETLADSDAEAIARLDRAWRAGKLRSVRRPYWRGGFFGRGDVQLTHEANYKKMGALIGVDLAARPELALNPAISARILIEGCLRAVSLRGDFTRYALEDFIAGDRCDYVGARRVVNGTDHAGKIAGYAETFERGLAAAGLPLRLAPGAAAPVPPPVSSPRPAPARAPRGLSPMISALIQSVGRHVLTGIAATLIAKGYVDAATSEAIIGGILALVGLGMSFAEKLPAKDGAAK